MSDLIAELKALKEKATPGPWYHRQAGEVSKRVQFPLGGYSKAGEPYDWIADDPRLGCHKKIIVGRGAFYGGTADYALVCALVNHLPTILARLEEGERMREALHVIATQSGYEWSETREQLKTIIDAAVECARTALEPTHDHT